jgi:beta-1,4-mannosyl-glycoprotein beta-1,4-N-acetylglucosaminyltransferase
MIYDCFQFFNELDLLKLRLNVLNPVVDFFVISEATVTFSGDSKPLYYGDNKSLFKEFHHKIIHNVVTDTPDLDPFERDRFQKNAVKRGLSNCTPKDIILFSDLDEIPNPDIIREAIASIQNDKVYHFAQRQFYFYLNMEEVSGKLLSFSGEFENIKCKKWLGTKMCKYDLVNKYSLDELRFPKMKECGIRLENGGWHFTYMGGDKNTDLVSRISHKIKSAAHQEFNNPNILNNIQKNVFKKKDVFGRKSKFAITDIDQTFPNYLVDNFQEFNHLIYHKNDNKKHFGFFG